MLARTQSRFHDVRVRLENYVPRTAGGRLFWELFLFGFKQGWACLFGGALLALLLLTKWLWPAGAPLTRYDFLFRGSARYSGDAVASADGDRPRGADRLRVPCHRHGYGVVQGDRRLLGL